MSEPLKPELSRRSPRRAFRRPVGILCEGEYNVEQALQISEGGMLIEGDLDLAAQDGLVVTLILPGGGTVIALAQVAYVRKADQKNRVKAFGLQFVDLALPKKRLIRNYVAAKTEAEAETTFENESEELFDRTGRDRAAGTKTAIKKAAQLLRSGFQIASGRRLRALAGLARLVRRQLARCELVDGERKTADAALSGASMDSTATCSFLNLAAELDEELLSFLRFRARESVTEFAFHGTNRADRLLVV